MPRSTDISRHYQEFQADRIRQLVRQHEARQNQQKQEALPGAGLFGFVAGWLLMSMLDKDRQK